MKTFLICSILLMAGMVTSDASSSVDVYSSAVANEFADKLMHNMREFLFAHNGDPALLPDISANFTIDFLGEHHGTLDLQNPTLIGLTTVKRAGDAFINNALRIATIKLDLILDLTMSGDYDMTIMGLTPGGHMVATITKQELKVDLRIDLKETVGVIELLEMKNSGKVDIKFSDSGLSDIVLNLVSDAVIGLFKGKIMDTLADLIKTEINGVLTAIGPILPQIPTDSTNTY